MVCGLYISVKLLQKKARRVTWTNMKREPRYIGEAWGATTEKYI